jgi:hypothetical protein
MGFNKNLLFSHSPIWHMQALGHISTIMIPPNSPLLQALWHKKGTGCSLLRTRQHTHVVVKFVVEVVALPGFEPGT